MKKRLLTIVILLVLFLTACAGRTAGADDAERLPAESVTMLDEGVWPVNAYTEGLPVPHGTVTWAMLDASASRSCPRTISTTIRCAWHRLAFPQ